MTNAEKTAHARIFELSQDLGVEEALRVMEAAKTERTQPTKTKNAKRSPFAAKAEGGNDPDMDAVTGLAGGLGVSKARFILECAEGLGYEETFRRMSLATPILRLVNHIGVEETQEILEDVQRMGRDAFNRKMRAIASPESPDVK